MDEFTNFTAALLVLMNLAILITVIGFLLLAVGGGPGRRRITRVNVSRPGAVVALDQSRGTSKRCIFSKIRPQEEAA
jgi:hypothetical protein